MLTKFMRTLAAAALGLGTAGSAVAQENWDAIVEAAKEEGSVVLYNSQLGSPQFVAVIEAFEDEYGITVQSMDVRASELSERVRTEQSAGRYLGDILMHSSGSIQILREQQGVEYEPIGDLPNIANLRADMADQAADDHVPGFLQAYGILVNTNLVAPEDEPQTWTDLADPKWQGKILSDDMRPLGSGGTMFTVLYKTYGREFAESLAENKPVFSRDLRGDSLRVARGEYPIFVPQMFAFANDLDGLPIKVIVPEAGVPYVPIHFAILRDAPNPNAARVFINHFLSTEQQTTYAEAWMLPVVDGVVENLDEESQRYANANLLGTRELDEYGPMMEIATEIFEAVP